MKKKISRSCKIGKLPINKLVLTSPDNHHCMVAAAQDFLEASGDDDHDISGCAIL